MATPTRIREVAFHRLFQLDVQGVAGEIEDGDAEPLTGRDLDKADALARGAFDQRREADEAIERYAPGWPAHRQPAVDRAILRLAFHELVSKATPPGIAINEAVELAKRYSTERSPGFINAILDRVHKEIVEGKTLESVVAVPEAPMTAQDDDEPRPPLDADARDDAPPRSDEP